MVSCQTVPDPYSSFDVMAVVNPRFSGCEISGLLAKPIITYNFVSNLWNLYFVHKTYKKPVFSWKIFFIFWTFSQLRSNFSSKCPTIFTFHYENMPIQIYWKFYHQKSENFQIKKLVILHISAQNIDCGYLLEPPQRGGSNEYPQSMFLSRNKKNNVYPCKPQCYYIKVGFKGVKCI